MVEKKPEFKTWITDCSIYSLTSRFAKCPYEIGDVRACAAMVDVQKKPAFIVFRMLDRQKSVEHMLW